MSTEYDGFERRGAYFVYGCANRGIKETGIEGALAGWILPKTIKFSVDGKMRRSGYRAGIKGFSILRREDIAEEDFFDVFGFYTLCTLKGS